MREGGFTRFCRSEGRWGRSLWEQRTGECYVCWFSIRSLGLSLRSRFGDKDKFREGQGGGESRSTDGGGTTGWYGVRKSKEGREYVKLRSSKVGRGKEGEGRGGRGGREEGRCEEVRGRERGRIRGRSLQFECSAFLLAEDSTTAARGGDEARPRTLTSVGPPCVLQPRTFAGTRVLAGREAAFEKVSQLLGCR